MLFSLLFVCTFSLITVPTTICWPEPLVPREYVLASNHFGFQLLNKRSMQNMNEELRSESSAPKSSEKENIFFSPFSITTVMSMLQQGAGGETFNQLNNVLGFHLARMDSDKSMVAERVRSTIQELSSIDSDGNISLNMANALMINKVFRINENFNETIQKYFDSELLEADFASEGDLVMRTINTWCSEKTHGKIPRFLRTPPHPTTQMGLINAIYFKGNWKNKFPVNLTEQATFYGLNNETYDIPFMKRQGRLVTAYLSELESDLVELPYQGDDVSMFAILPRQSSQSNLIYIHKALNPWYVESAISRLNEENEATVIFPKLRVVGRYNLKETLRDIGLVDVFEPGRADLKGITEEDITVDEIRHHAVMDINEDGTEAAASTYVGFVKMSLQPSSTYNFNHPFVMFIRHNPSGQILFMGEINKP